MCMSAYVCARLQVYLCMCGARDEARYGVRVRWENEVGHKGCSEAQDWEGGKEKLRSGGGWRWGEGVLLDYPVHLAQLCRPTHSHQSSTPYLPEA